MKLLSISAIFASLLASSTASAEGRSTAKVVLPSSFEPPKAFKNQNLVHIISLEKNYAKENINVLIENVSPGLVDEYFLPFTADQFARVGGIEVNDRKNPDAGRFEVLPVEYDNGSDTQYYRIQLPKALKAGEQQTIGISFSYLKAYAPLPSSIRQDEKQYLTYDFSAFCQSAYVTAKQKTEVKFSSSNIPDFTTIGEGPQNQGSKLVYGPYSEQAAFAHAPARVRFEFTKPVLHVATLERDIEVSHWGGNVAFEERYDLYNRGANMSSSFSRVKWQQSQYSNPTTWALKELKFPLSVGSADTYYTDVIGNVTTSRFRSNKREALLEAKPRYPVFGGWKYPFTIGWNANANSHLRKTESGEYVLNVPFLEGPKQPEGIEYGEVRLQVLLPEGAENVKFYTTIPESAITESTTTIRKTYLDTVGRTAIIITAKNIVDEFRGREVIITYTYPLLAGLRKPLVIFVSTLSIFVAGWVVGGLNVGFSRTTRK